MKAGLSFISSSHQSQALRGSQMSLGIKLLSVISRKSIGSYHRTWTVLLNETYVREISLPYDVSMSLYMPSSWSCTKLVTHLSPVSRQRPKVAPPWAWPGHLAPSFRAHRSTQTLKGITEPRSWALNQGMMWPACRRSLLVATVIRQQLGSWCGPSSNEKPLNRLVHFHDTN